MQRRLIIFTRYPDAGEVKTRLIPALGAAGAAQLHRDMTSQTLHLARELRRLHGVEIEVRFAGQSVQEMQRMYGDDLEYVPQCEGDLGQRIAEAVGDPIEHVAVIGTDCPELSASHVLAAYASLEDHDVVLGPATDGGYYLIGLRQSMPELFQGIAWGTESVCAETRRIAAFRGLSVALLETLSDVDRPEDLPIWEHAQRRNGCSGQLISVVIPVLNEAASLPGTLAQFAGRTNTEVIVVDGGSTDDTCRIANQHGARVVHACRGRGRQMNAGAEVATGSALLFLHADTRLPSGFASYVHETLARPSVSMGAFRLQIDAPGRSLRLIEWVANLRATWFQLPYGDQAIFVSTEMFRRFGGFAELPIMEDVELVRRYCRHGRIAIAPATITTSGRRWLRLGVVGTTCVNGTALFAYFLGFSPNRIAQWYHRGHLPPSAPVDVQL